MTTVVRAKARESAYPGKRTARDAHASTRQHARLVVVPPPLSASHAPVQPNGAVPTVTPDAIAGDFSSSRPLEIKVSHGTRLAAYAGHADGEDTVYRRDGSVWAYADVGRVEVDGRQEERRLVLIGLIACEMRGQDTDSTSTPTDATALDLPLRLGHRYLGSTPVTGRSTGTPASLKSALCPDAQARKPKYSSTASPVAQQDMVSIWRSQYRMYCGESRWWSRSSLRCTLLYTHSTSRIGLPHVKYYAKDDDKMRAIMHTSPVRAAAGAQILIGNMQHAANISIDIAPTSAHCRASEVAILCIPDEHRCPGFAAPLRCSSQLPLFVLVGFCEYVGYA